MDGGGEPVGGGLGQLDRLLVGVEPGDGNDRSEDLFGKCPHGGTDMIQDSRGVEAAVVLAAGVQDRTGLD